MGGSRRRRSRLRYYLRGYFRKLARGEVALEASPLRGSSRGVANLGTTLALPAPNAPNRST